MRRRPIEGFPAYQVSADGILFSNHKGIWREVVLSPDAGGYLCAVLCNGASQRRSIRIHRLVAEAFIPNPDGLPCVRHMDGNPKNNHVENLAWGTYRDNEMDKLRHGTWDSRKTGKLTLRDRQIARRLSEDGVSQKVIARALGVSRPTITRLLNNTIWNGDDEKHRTEGSPT